MEEVGPLDLEPAPRAVAVLPAKLDRAGAAPMLEQLGVERLGALRVAFVDERPAPGPHEALGIVAEDGVDRRAHVADRSVGLHDQDDVGRVLHQSPEALLARPEPLLVARQPAMGAAETEDAEAEPADRCPTEPREHGDARGERAMRPL